MVVDIYTYLAMALISLVLSGSIVLVFKKHPQLGGDYIKGPQKIHFGSVPRIGGVSLFVTLVISWGLIDENLSQTLFLLVLPTLPIFFAGMMEDFTRSVSVRSRLGASFVSGGLFCWLTGYGIKDVDIDSLQFLFAIPLVSLLLTSLALAALMNAFNIIDGLNGLSGGTAIIMLLSFSALSAQTGDIMLTNMCLLIIAVIFGFLVWNFPFGKIFIGDGGAYLIGALTASLAIILPENSNEISPFTSLIIILFPLYELIRSVIRRGSKSFFSAFDADNKHFHSLMFKAVESFSHFSRPIQNSLASLITLLMPLFCCIWGVIFYDNRNLLIAGVFGFICIYELAVMLLMLAMRSSRLEK